MQTPNNKFHFGLTFGTSVIVIILFSLLIYNINNNSITLVISCLISIFGGAVASIIVSWLIDVATCRRNNNLIISRKNKNFNNIEFYIDELFQAFANTCYNAVEQHQEGNWEHWIKILDKYDYYKGSSDFYEKMLFIYVNLNCLISELDEANSGELKEHYIQSPQAISSELILLLDALKRLREKMFLCKEENIEHIIFTIKDVLLTIVPLVQYHEKKYTPRSFEH